jgi:hypothetical protein
MNSGRRKRDDRLLPPKRERGFANTGYTIAGYPFVRFGVPTILHAKKMELASNGWRDTGQDCGGIMKPVKLWVNDLPNGYEVVLGLQCQDCEYTDSIRLPYEGHKQLFNSTSNRTWSLKESRSSSH